MSEEMICAKCKTPPGYEWRPGTACSNVNVLRPSRCTECGAHMPPRCSDLTCGFCHPKNKAAAE